MGDNCEFQCEECGGVHSNGLYRVGGRMLCRSCNYQRRKARERGASQQLEKSENP